MHLLIFRSQLTLIEDTKIETQTAAILSRSRYVYANSDSHSIRKFICLVLVWVLLEYE